MFVGYLGVVAFGVFGPAPEEPIRRAGDGVRRVAEEVGGGAPGRATRDPERGAGEDPLVAGLTDEATANVAMFVPFGLLLPLVAPRWRWRTIPAGLALSATIELIQLLLLSWRSPSLADIAWNGLGTVIGFSLWLAGWAGWQWRASRGRDEAPRPTAARVEQ